MPRFYVPDDDCSVCGRTKPYHNEGCKNKRPDTPEPEPKRDYGPSEPLDI